MKYVSVAAYWVIDEIKDGKNVFAFDRQTRSVKLVNEMTVNDSLAMLRNAEKDSGRYEFWYEEEEVENG
jgi:hypothetical protein